MTEKIEVNSLDEVDLKAGEKIVSVTGDDLTKEFNPKTLGAVLVRLKVVNSGLEETQLYLKQ